MTANFVQESCGQPEGLCESESRVGFFGSAKDLDTTNFSQVIFPEISDYFPPGKDVRVTYVLTETMEPSSRDWVGLFRVGWSNVGEYMTFVWTPKMCPSQRNHRPIVVTFSAYYLPSDRSEFYQFCYVSKQGLVRGASTPFQFREPSECDQLVEVEDETGMIVLKTKSAVLQEHLDNLITLKESLEQKLLKLGECNSTLSSTLDDTTLQLEATKKEVFAKDKECMKLKVELGSAMQSTLDAASNLKIKKEENAMLEENLNLAKMLISDLKAEEIRLSRQLTDSNLNNVSELTSLNEQLDTKARKINELESAIADLAEDLKVSQLRFEELQKTDQAHIESFELSSAALKKECNETMAKFARCQEEKELFKDQFAHSEEARRDIMHQIDILKKSMQNKDIEIQEKANKIFAYEEKGRMLKNELNEVSKQNHVQACALESRLSNMEDKLNACESSKRLISNELTEARDHRDKLMSELHRTKKEKDQIMRELEESRRRFDEMRRANLKLKETDKREDQRVAGQEGKLIDQSTISKEREWKLLIEPSTRTKESIISDLKVQIDDLHTRLSMGAAAYSEKYIECHKLEKRLKKLQKQKSMKTVVSDIQSPGHDTMTSDSQEEPSKILRISTGTKTKVPSEEVLMEDPDQLQDQQISGRNFMSKLEKLFMAIADPDIEEQECSDHLKVRLEEMENTVQSQHSKYRKYKKLYQDEKSSHARDLEKSQTENATLESELDCLRRYKESIEHENKELKGQLQEVVKNSSPENSMKGGEVLGMVITASSSDSLMRKSVDPLLGNFSYETDLSDELQLASARFGALGLCPKNQRSDDSDIQDLAHHAPTSGVIKRQPTRSPPLIEVISGDLGDDDECPSPAVSSTSNLPTRHRNCTRTKRSALRKDFA